MLFALALPFFLLIGRRHHMQHTKSSFCRRAGAAPLVSRHIEYQYMCLSVSKPMTPKLSESKIKKVSFPQKKQIRESRSHDIRQTYITQINCDYCPPLK